MALLSIFTRPLSVSMPKPLLSLKPNERISVLILPLLNVVFAAINFNSFKFK